jgi:hypothetical protein
MIKNNNCYNKKNIPLFYSTNGVFKNLGDDISPYILSKLTRRAVEIYCENRKVVLFSVGSILDKVKFSSQIVWGSGFMHSESKVVQSNVFAVRGPLSLKKLDLIKPIPVGDPVLLMPEIYKAIKTNEFKIGIIPHYIDQKTFIQRFKQDCSSEFLVLNIMTNKFEEFIDQMCRCEFVVSSSLHGLILAHAYGIPAIWIEMSQKVIGHGFKFFDYFLSVSIPPYRGINFKTGEIALSNLILLSRNKRITMEIVNFNNGGLVESLEQVTDYLDKNLS